MKRRAFFYFRSPEVFYVVRDFKKPGKKYSITAATNTKRIMNPTKSLLSGSGGQVNSV
jgi:hypothetical protein